MAQGEGHRAEQADKDKNAHHARVAVIIQDTRRDNACSQEFRNEEEIKPGIKKQKETLNQMDKINKKEY